MFDEITPEAIRAFGELTFPMALIILGIVALFVIWRISEKQIESQRARDKNQADRAEADEERESHFRAAAVATMKLLERNTDSVDTLVTSQIKLIDHTEAMRGSVQQVGEQVESHDTKMDERVVAINDHTTEVAGEVALAAQATILEALAQTEERMKLSLETASAEMLGRVEAKLAGIVDLVDEHKCRLAEVQP